MEEVEVEAVSEKQPAKDEKNLKVESIHIKFLDDGSCVYETFSERKNGKEPGMGTIVKKSRSTASFDELTDFLKKDWESLYIKKALPGEGAGMAESSDKKGKRVFSE